MERVQKLLRKRTRSLDSSAYEELPQVARRGILNALFAPKTNEELKDAGEVALEHLARRLDDPRPDGPPIRTVGTRRVDPDAPHYEQVEVLPEWATLASHGRLRVNVEGKGLVVSLNDPPHITTDENRILYFDQEDDQWKKNVNASAWIEICRDIWREEESRRSAHQRAAALEQRLAQTEELLKAAAARSRSDAVPSGDDSLVVVGDELDETVPTVGSENLAELVEKRAWLSLPAFKAGQDYRAYLQNFKLSWQQFGFPDYLLWRGAIQKTSSHPHHDYLVQGLLSEEIHNWESLKKVMSRRFESKLSAGALLEKAGNLRMSKKEKEEESYDGFMCRLKREVEHAVKEIPRIPQESKEYLVSFFSAFFFVRAIPADMATHIRLSSPDLYSPEKVLSAAIKFSMNEREQKMYHGGRATAGAVGYDQEEKQPPSRQGPGPSHGNPPQERRNPPQESRKLTQSQLEGVDKSTGICGKCKGYAKRTRQMPHCTHCHRCGSSDHRVAQCPDPPPPPRDGGGGGGGQRSSQA